jgi:hypothetical protein
MVLTLCHQVLLSFFIVAVLTYAIVIYTYLFRPRVYRVDSFNRLDSAVVSTIRASLLWLRDLFRLKRPSARHFQSQNLHETISGKTPQVKRRSQCPGHASSTSMTKTDEAFYSILLALSDQQLFTGFAVLTVAYIQMDSVTSYHAAIVECMATLAFVVYESTSTIMYYQLRDPDKFFMMTWRAILILVFMALLLVTQLPLGNQYWLYIYGTQYKCFWRSFPGNYVLWDNALNFFSMIFNMFCISWGMCNTLANYFPEIFGWIFTNSVSSYIVSAFAKTAMLPRHLSSRSLSKSRETSSRFFRIVCRAFGMIAYIAAFIVFILVELFNSQAFNFLLNWYLIVSSVTSSIDYRTQASSHHRQGDEDKWGFGQAVPLFLVASPIFTLFEAVHGMNSSPFCSCLHDVLTSRTQMRSACAEPGTRRLLVLMVSACMT